ncbi:unnamed protein product [Rotaria sordida]|uniref:Uncharacterized protein n=1 Tax=Rotaria sordida TaxID=392033 RepID=A0A813YYI1_9BILA|nr:unnamed protein product [Rotaria sordida]
MKSPELSVWSFDVESNTPKINSSATAKSSWEEEEEKEEEDDNKKRRKIRLACLWPLCIQCCIVGALLGGIALAVVITLWLKPMSTNTAAGTISTTSASTTTTATSTTSSATTSTTTATSTTSSATTSTTVTSTTSSASTSTTTTVTSTTSSTSTSSGTTTTGMSNYHATNRVIRYPPDFSNGTTVAGKSGASSSALDRLNNPLGVAVDDDLNLYVVDEDNKRVMKWAPNATNGTIVIGSASTANLYGILLSLYSSSEAYVSSENGNAVYLWTFGASSPRITLTQVNSTSSSLNGPMDEYRVLDECAWEWVGVGDLGEVPHSSNL